MKKLSRWTSIYLVSFIVAGLISLGAYLRIAFLYRGHPVKDAPPILLVLSIPLLISGVYGLKTKKSFTKQPVLLRTFTIAGVLTSILVVVFVIFALIMIGEALKGNPLAP
jgi:hypothetical protein